VDFTLLGENDIHNPIETIFRNRGIDDTFSLLTCDDSYLISYNALRNIEKAVTCLLQHVEDDSEVFVQVDSDIDGYSAAATLINYLYRVFPGIKITWKLQEGKGHGVQLKDVPESAKLVIIPDAGSNQYEEHRQLFDKGIDVIVLDHHECEKESKHAIVVNNQLSPEYLNKNFSGAGIVYKFCKALDDKLNTSYADDFLDLVAFGNIGDMIDLRELETRYLVKQGLQQIKNPLLEALIDKQEYSLNGKVNIIGAAFYIVPLINAGIRVGTYKEKEGMMRSFLEQDEEVYYKRGKCYESLHTSIARTLYNLRNKQNKLKASGTEVLLDKIQDKLDKKVLILNITDAVDKNLTGLVANQLADKYKRPVILLREREPGFLAGSARGQEKVVEDFKEYLTNTGLFVFCEGHGNAFGVEIEEKNLNKLEEVIKNDESLKIIQTDSKNVDLLFEEYVKRDTVLKIAEYKDEWGSTLNEPKIAIKDIPIPVSSVQLLGKKRKLLKFHYNGVDFIKQFFKEEDFYRDFNEGETIYLDILGKCQVNEWEGNKTPQIDIIEYEITDLMYF